MILFQTKGFLVESARWRLQGNPGKEVLNRAQAAPDGCAQEWYVHTCTSTCSPEEEAYVIMDWLLSCTAKVEDNLIMPLCASLQDALCKQDNKLQEAVQKVQDQSQDSKWRRRYQEARDHDSEQSNSDKEVAQAMSQVKIHSSSSESSVARHFGPRRNRGGGGGGHGSEQPGDGGCSRRKPGR